MKKNLLLFAVTAVGLLSPLSASAEDASAAAAPAAEATEQAAPAPLPPAEQKAVDTYRLRVAREIVKNMPAAITSAQDDEPSIQIMLNLLDACKNTSVDGMPAEYKEFVAENVEKLSGLFQELKPLISTAETAEGQEALEALEEKGEQMMKNLAAKYPNAYSALGLEAMGEFLEEIIASLDPNGKAMELVEKDPSLQGDMIKLMTEVFNQLVKEIDAKLAE